MRILVAVHPKSLCSGFRRPAGKAAGGVPFGFAHFTCPIAPAAEVEELLDALFIFDNMICPQSCFPYPCMLLGSEEIGATTERKIA